VEFNARFGDPETQVVLALLESPLGRLLHAAATGRLAELPPLQWRDGAAVTVVLAAPGYPAAPRLGDVVTGADRPGIIHAGTRTRDDGAVLSAGGRVLCATAVAPTLSSARERAYELIAGVSLPGGQYRTDIAERAARDGVTVPAP
jgi:phosphoribosylamine--glycine ligase